MKSASKRHGARFAPDKHDLIYFANIKREDLNKNWKRRWSKQDAAQGDEQQANPTTRRQVVTEWETRWNVYLDTRTNRPLLRREIAQKTLAKWDTRWRGVGIRLPPSSEASLSDSKPFWPEYKSSDTVTVGVAKLTAEHIIMHCSLLDHMDLFSIIAGDWWTTYTQLQHWASGPKGDQMDAGKQAAGTIQSIHRDIVQALSSSSFVFFFFF